MTSRGAVACCIVAFLSLAGGSAIGAQTTPPATAVPVTIPPLTILPPRWPEPLARRIVVHLRDVPLRDALDQVAAAARLRLTYSAELLPLDRPVRAAFDSATAGDALLQLLRGTPATPVFVGGDQVVLAPVGGGAEVADAAGAVAARHTAQTLDRVVVTGSAAGAPQRSRAIALDVIPGSTLAAQASGTLAQALDGAVPGVWLWDQSPAAGLARYGSIRGASSFGVSYPKVYIDGIEVANPLVVSRFDPEDIDRIEVIRGPQGAALYGSDAISGVVNIVTRHDGVDSGARGARLRSTAGASQTDYAGHPVLVQEHGLALRTGSNLRSAGLDVSAGSLGDYFRGGASQHVVATGGARVVGRRGSVTATAHWFSEDGGGTATAFPADRDYSSGTSSGPGGGAMRWDDGGVQRVREYTLGATGKLLAGDRWTHTLVAGIDGYRLGNATTGNLTPFTSLLDSALGAARGGADRLTARASSIVQLGAGSEGASALTFALEHSALREETPLFPSGSEYGGRRSGSRRATSWAAARGAEAQAYAPREATLVQWLTSSGAVAQLDASWRDALYLTGGVRLERNDAYADAPHYSTLPMVGAAWVLDRGPATFKLRAAYGEGIRAPRTASRETILGAWRAAAAMPGLAPEAQHGIEIGSDLSIGRAFSLQLTRFDQIATGLIQQVAVAGSAAAPPDSTPRIGFALQNVGAIANRGWELQSALRRGALALTATGTLTRSVMTRRAVGYTGDLEVGDRMVDVPARTVSLGASWTGARWLGSLGVSRAFDWIDYDRVALARDFRDATYQSSDFVGASLRAYRVRYDGVTRLRAAFSHALGRGLTVEATGENLLDYQRGEPDNLTIVPGRTVTAGFRATF